MATKKTVYLRPGKAAEILGISSKSVVRAFDEGSLSGFRSTKQGRKRMVSISSLIGYCERHGLQEAINPLRAMARDAYALPPVLFIGPFPPNKYRSFDAAFADDLLMAGLLAGQRNFNAILTDGIIGSENLNTVLRRFKGPEFCPALLCALVPADVQPEAWLRAGYDLAWRNPVDHEQVAAELMAALRTKRAG